MATAKQTSIRFAGEDFEIQDAILRRTGVFSQSDAIRYALRGAEEPKKAKPQKK